MGWWYGYEPSRPRAVKDGIKLKKQRGQIGETWWSKRWLDALERFTDPARLGRGRSYARAGQVVSMDVAPAPGVVKAKVQGSRPQPYTVTITLKPLSDQEWDRVTDAMAAQAVFAAKLLAGEMPKDIEEAFNAAGTPLFPTQAKDLETDCSCPDWANPCKHVAAVYYILAEQFDEDPFLIFKLRGRSKDDIIGELREKRAATVSEQGEPGSRGEKEREGEGGAAEAVEEETAPPLVECLADFWRMEEAISSFSARLALPDVPDAVLRRLGSPPFVVAGQNGYLHLSQLYRTVAEQANHKLLAGE